MRNAKKICKKIMALALSTALTITALAFFDAGTLSSLAADFSDDNVLVETGFLLPKDDCSNINEELSGMCSDSVEDKKIIVKSVETAEENSENNSSEEPIVPSANPFRSIINFIKDIAAFIKALVEFINKGMPGLPFNF